MRWFFLLCVLGIAAAGTLAVLAEWTVQRVLGACALHLGVAATLGLWWKSLSRAWPCFHFRGDVRFASVLPMVGLSWLNRLLRRGLRSEA